LIGFSYRPTGSAWARSEDFGEKQFAMFSRDAARSNHDRIITAFAALGSSAHGLCSAKMDDDHLLKGPRNSLPRCLPEHPFLRAAGGSHPNAP
jgi:hypothetical protein